MAIDNTVKLINDLAVVIGQAISLAKNKNWLSALGMISPIMELVPEAKAALPELESLDTEEAAQICAAAYQALVQVLQKA